MNVPDEAVEAAARALHEAGDWDVAWTGDDWRAEVARNEARAALTAAAPFIAAQAWDEGFKQGGPMHDVNYDDPDAHTRNPYRSVQ